MLRQHTVKAPGMLHRSFTTATVSPTLVSNRSLRLIIMAVSAGPCSDARTLYHGLHIAVSRQNGSVENPSVQNLLSIRMSSEADRPLPAVHTFTEPFRNTYPAPACLSSWGRHQSCGAFKQAVSFYECRAKEVRRNIGETLLALGKPKWRSHCLRSRAACLRYPPT